MKGREEENERNSFCFLLEDISLFTVYTSDIQDIYICYQPRIIQRLVYQKTAITSGKLLKAKAKKHDQNQHNGPEHSL